MKLYELNKHPFYQKNKKFIIPSLSIGICLLLIIFVVVPQIKSTLENRKKAENLTTQVAALNNKLKTLNSIDEKQYQEYSNISLVVLPKDQDIPGAIGALMNLLKSNQIGLKNIGFTNPRTSPSGRTSTYNIKLELEAEIQDAKKLVTDIKLSPRLFRLADIELILPKVGSKTQINLSLTAYFQDLPANLGNVEQKLDLVNVQDFQLLANIKNSSQFFPQTDFEAAPNIATGKEDPFK